MKLTVLLENLEYQVIQGTLDKDVTALIYHSDKVFAGSMFFAIKGNRYDGEAYILKAVEKGATVIITETVDGSILAAVHNQVTVITVKNVRKALAICSSNFYRHPERSLLTIGVTGTKGKTTTTFMIKEILQNSGIPTGIIGTVSNGFEGHFEEALNTTPQSEDVYRYMRQMADGGCKAVVMEVSSQAMMHSRVDGIIFDIGVFTNISPDHIGSGEHSSFDEYLFWKSQMAEKCRTAIFNCDNKYWNALSHSSRALYNITFGKNGAGDFTAENIKLKFIDGVPGIEYTVCGHSISVPLPGVFNVENSMAAITAVRCLGIEWKLIEDSLRTIKIRGRVENVKISNDFTVLLDYAHNGTALENLLTALRAYNPPAVKVLFGCGGNRDPNRRFEMGKAAFELADFSVVTSDNPRDEDPMNIIRDITSVMADDQGKYTVIPVREDAIRWIIYNAEPGDIIVIAGKGHETYQIIGKEKKHFDDREIILSCKGRTKDENIHNIGNS